MSELKIFENEQFGRIRTMEIDSTPYFVGKDVAEVLGYERPTKAIADHVDMEDKDEIPIQDSIGRMQKNSYHQRKRTLQPYSFKQAPESKRV